MPLGTILSQVTQFDLGGEPGFMGGWCPDSRVEDSFSGILRGRNVNDHIFLKARFELGQDRTCPSILPCSCICDVRRLLQVEENGCWGQREACACFREVLLLALSGLSEASGQNSHLSTQRQGARAQMLL